MERLSYWFLKPLTKSSGGKFFAGLVESFSRVANGVVVLAVSQTPEHHGGSFPVPHRFLSACTAERRQFLSGELREVVDPRPQSRFFRAGLRNPLTARVADTGSRLQQKQRFFGMVAVDEFDQRLPERIDSRRRDVLFGEMQAGWGRDAFRIMAGPATRLFQYGIHSAPGRKPAGRAQRSCLRAHVITSCRHLIHGYTRNHPTPS